MKTLKQTENRIDNLRKEMQARPETADIQRVWVNLDALWVEVTKLRAQFELHAADKKAHK